MARLFAHCASAPDFGNGEPGSFRFLYLLLPLNWTRLKFIWVLCGLGSQVALVTRSLLSPRRAVQSLTGAFQKSSAAHSCALLEVFAYPRSHATPTEQNLLGARRGDVTARHGASSAVQYVVPVAGCVKHPICFDPVSFRFCQKQEGKKVEGFDRIVSAGTCFPAP